MMWACVEKSQEPPIATKTVPTNNQGPGPRWRKKSLNSPPIMHTPNPPPCRAIPITEPKADYNTYWTRTERAHRQQQVRCRNGQDRNHPMPGNTGGRDITEGPVHRFTHAGAQGQNVAQKATRLQVKEMRLSTLNVNGGELLKLSLK